MHPPEPTPDQPFRRATAVQRTAGEEWAAEVQPGWDIAGNANGGYLLAMAVRALTQATGRPHPVSVTAHYLAPAQTGPVVIEAAVLKSGRQFATGRALMRAQRPLIAVLATLGHLRAEQLGRSLLIEGNPPELPPPEDCIGLVPGDTFPPPFVGNVEMRLHPDDAGFATGAHSGQPLIRGWFRLRQGEPVDAIALLCAVDAFPPTTFNARLPVAWTPTLELTAHVRAVPAPGWLRCRFSTRFVTSGFLEEDGEIWDTEDRLVAQSRQLALVPRG